MSQLGHTKPLEFDGSATAPVEQREQLLCQVTALLVLAADVCSDEQLDLFGSVLTQLAEMSETHVRAVAADRMAKLVRAPKAIVRSLSEDTIDVARPILVHSMALTNSDLVRIAGRQGPQHLAAIAARDRLSDDVTDLLVARGDGEVHRLVAANPGAQFSRSGFAGLLAACRDDTRLQEIVARRTDLSGEAVEALLVMAGDDVRAVLAAAGEGAGRDDQDDEYWLSRYDFESAWRRAQQPAEARRLDETLLRQVAQDDRFADAVAVFALLTECSLDHAKSLMVREDTDPFLITARAAGISMATVQELLKCGPWRFRLAHTDREASLLRFNQLTPHWARKIRSQIRSGVLGP